ncbi:hypothetical protein CDEF62S_03473 [Castellaniella defragrans]
MPEGLPVHHRAVNVDGSVLETLWPSANPHCPACIAAQGAGAHYFDKVFAPNAPTATIAKLISEDLGFCSRHGRVLAADAKHAKAVAQSFRAATERILPLLHQSVTDERCERLFFRSARRCPACSAEEAAAAKALTPIRKRWMQTMEPLGTVALLCEPHFQMFTAQLPVEPRGHAIRQYLDVLAIANQDMERAPDAGLPRALALLGYASVPHQTDALQRVNGGDAHMPIEDILDNPDVRPICEAMGAAHTHWLEGLRWAVENEAAGCLWLFAPCCKHHVFDASQLGRPDWLARIAALALSGMAEQSRQQLANIIRILALADQPRPSWYKPRHRRRKASNSTGLHLAKDKRFVLRCQGCEAEAVALEQASAAFLDLMHHTRYRNLLAHGYGLCLDHLVHVLPVASPNLIRPFLGQLHTNRLEALRNALADPSGAPGRERDAVRRFRGWSVAHQHA